MPRLKIYDQKELDRIRSDMIECQSLGQDLEAAKRAGIPGIEILQDRYKECLKGLEDLNNEYGKKK